MESSGIRVIITGATGMVGEGVMLECLQNKNVAEVLLVSRRSTGRQHPKLKELLLSDFSDLKTHRDKLRAYDACFYCAGVSSVGKNEEQFYKATYEVVVPFAKVLSEISPNMVFIYVSGSRTDSSETGKVMWARVKGKTENALAKLPFKAEYNFRPGIMKPMSGQKNVLLLYKIAGFYPFWATFFPNISCRLQEVGLAMINCVLKGYPNKTIEVSDIKILSKT